MVHVLSVHMKVGFFLKYNLSFHISQVTLSIINCLK